MLTLMRATFLSDKVILTKNISSFKNTAGHVIFSQTNAKWTHPGAQCTVHSAQSKTVESLRQHCYKYLQ